VAAVFVGPPIRWLHVCRRVHALWFQLYVYCCGAIL